MEFIFPLHRRTDLNMNLIRKRKVNAWKSKEGFPYSAWLETATAASSFTIFFTSHVIKPKFVNNQY